MSDIKVSIKHLMAIPVEYYEDFYTEPVIAWRSFGSYGHFSDMPYFENVMAIHRAVELERPNPFNDETYEFDSSFSCDDNFLRFMHVDLALNQDYVGIAMCHICDWKYVITSIRWDKTKKRKILDRDIRPVYKFDFLGRIKAPSDGDIDFEEMREIIYEVDQRGFPLQLITYDKFQSYESVQLLRKRGFTVAHLSMDRTSRYPVVDVNAPKHNIRYDTTEDTKAGTLSGWNTYKVALNTDRLLLPYYRPLPLEDLENYGLEDTIDDFGNKGKPLTWIEKETMQAMYISKAPGKVIEQANGSIDLLEACAGAVYNASNNVEYIPEQRPDQKRKETAELRNSARTLLEQEEAYSDDENAIDDDGKNFWEDDSILN